MIDQKVAKNAIKQAIVKEEKNIGIRVEENPMDANKLHKQIDCLMDTIDCGDFSNQRDVAFVVQQKDKLIALKRKINEQYDELLRKNVRRMEQLPKRFRPANFVVEDSSVDSSN